MAMETRTQRLRKARRGRQIRVFPPAPAPRPPPSRSTCCRTRPSGRSHRAAVGKAKLKAAIDGTREVLGIPDDYRIGIVPASDTGAVEMAMWSMLGERPARWWPGKASARAG